MWLKLEIKEKEHLAIVIPGLRRKTSQACLTKKVCSGS